MTIKNLEKKLQQIMAILHLENLDNRGLRRIKHAAIVLFSTFLILYIFGKILAAKWGVIDDHEIMYFLGRDSKLYLNEVLSFIKLTEAGHFGMTTRFRPSYYMLRLLETVLWGANPSTWYAFRIGVLILAVSLFWKLLSPRVGWLCGGLLCAYTLTFFYWVDIFGRLGPAEFYAVFGLPIYIWGLVNAIQVNSTKTRTILSGLAIFLGAIICIGTKENFLILIIPSMYVAVKTFKLKNISQLFFVIGSIIYGFYIGIAVILGLSQSGVDVYSRSISPLIRLQVVFSSYILKENLLVFGVLGLLIIVLGGLLLIFRSSKGIRKVLFQATFWLFMLIVIYFSQLVFYNGSWPNGTRYDFPGMLYIPAAIYILYIVAETIALEIPNIKYPRFVVKLGWIAALTILIFSRGYQPIIEKIEYNVSKTTIFTNRLDKIVTLLKQNPEKALVLESGIVWDYEPIFSYERFLRAYGVENPLFVRIHGYSPETETSDLEEQLASTLLNISNQGNALFQPLSHLSDYQNQCFSLDLSGTFDTECQPIP